MFSNDSRYAKQPTVEVQTEDGHTVDMVKLRNLPSIEGKFQTIKGNDRLDILSQQKYNHPTWYWHIADANTELEANALIQTPGRTIAVPEQ